MAEQILATSLVKFLGEDSQYQATRTRVVASTKALTSELSLSGAAAGGASGLVDQYGRAVASVGAAQPPVVEGGKKMASVFSSSSIEAGRAKGQFEAYMAPLRASPAAHGAAAAAAGKHGEALSKIAGASGALVPGLGAMMGVARQAAQQLSGMSTGMIAGAGAAGLAAIAIGLFVSRLIEANAAAKEAAFARLTQDVGAATAALTAGARAASDYQQDMETWTNTEGKATAAAGLLAGILITIDGIMGTTNAAVAKAIELNTGYMGSLQLVLGALKAESAMLSARGAMIGVEKARATTLTEIAKLSKEEAVNITRAGEIAAKEAQRQARITKDKISALIEEAKTEAEIANLRAQQRGIDKNTAVEVAAIRKKAAADRATAEIAAERAVMEVQAAKLAQEEKLIGMSQARAAAAAATADALLEGSRRMAQADAAFFNTSESGFAEYQAKKRAQIDETLARELAALAETAAAQRASQVLRRDAPSSTLAERTAASAAIQAIDQAEADGRIAASDKAKVAIQANEAQVVADRRQKAQEALSIEEGLYTHKAAMGAADYAGHLAFLNKAAQSENISTQQRMAYQEKAFAMYGQLVSKAAGYYDALASMGQVSATAQIAFLDRQSQNEKLSADQRIGFAQKAFDAKLALEQAYVDKAQAMGTMNETQNVQHLATIVGHYEQGSMKRIQAETAWANAVKALQVSVAQTGMALADQAIGALQKRGAAMVSLNSIQKETEANMAKALQTMKTLQAGGSVTPEALANAKAMGAAMADLTAKGQTAGGAMKVAFDLLENDLKGIPRTAGQAANSLGLMGPAASKVGSAMSGASDQIVSELGKIDNAIGGVEERFMQLGQGVGDGLAEGIGQSLDAALPKVDEFLDALDEKIASGSSRIGDTVFDLINTRIMAALDAERDRS